MRAEPQNGTLESLWISYKEKISALSEKLVEIQRPIRVLDAIKWDAKTEHDFFAAGARELPRVDTEYYSKIALGFDPEKKDLELADLGFLISRTLGDCRRHRLRFVACLRFFKQKTQTEKVRLVDFLFGESDAL